MSTRPARLVPLLVVLALVVFLPLVVLWFAKFNAAYVVGFVVAFGFLELYLPYRVYVDARPRGSGVATRWAAVVFFVPLVGFVAYYLVRESR